MKIEPIKTERLFLRGFEKEDALWAYSIWNDPKMGEYLLDEAKEGIDPEYLKMLETLGDDEEYCYLIPVLKESGQRIGTCSFVFLEDGDVCDVAYCVHKNFERQGFATEMVHGMMDYAKEQGAKKVTIWINEDNGPSNRVAQKCGGKVIDKKEFEKRGTGKKIFELEYEITL